jgi:hypothetical protein
MAHPGDIRTTNGKIFTQAQSAEMAKLVFLRFGEDLESATLAWRRMLQNSCSINQFAELVGYREPIHAPARINGLNADQDRRDELLKAAFEKNDEEYEKLFGHRVNPNPAAHYGGGIRHFKGLTVESLLQLIKEGFVNVHEQQNSSPRIRELLAFAEQFPEAEITFEGYAVHKERSDYRLSIDGLSFAKLPPNENAPGGFLRSWYELGQDASERDGKRLWWD